MFRLRSSYPVRATNSLIWRALVGVLLVSLMICTSPVHGAPSSPSSISSALSWDQINTDGFGYPSFNTTWSLAVFQNQLYAGTRRSLGTVIWRRTGDTQTWTNQGPPGWASENTAVPAMVNSSDTGFIIGTENANGSQVWEYANSSWINLNTNGFDNTGHNTAVWSLSVWGGTILAGTKNTTDGAGLFVYNSGAWTQIGTYGFGDAHNEIVTSMAWLGYYNLYVGTWNSNTGAEIWRYDGSQFGWIKKGGFSDADNWAARSMAVFDGRLYVGTFNSSDGGEIWRYNETNDTWLKVATGGFNSINNRGISVLYPFAGYLYAGTENTSSGAQIWRSSDGANWEPVMTGGFGDANNQEIPSLVGFGHWLIAGTRNYATGGEVWRSYPLGPDPAFQVSSTTLDAVNPDVAFNPNAGEYMVAWEDRDIYHSPLNISAQRFNAEGTIPGIISVSFAYGTNPQVAFNTDLNEYLVVWNGYSNAKGQLFDADGDPIGGQINYYSSGELKGMVFSPVTDDYVLLYTILSPAPHPKVVGLNVMTLTPGGQPDETIVVRAIDNTSEIHGADLAWNHAHNECLVVWSEQTTHGTFVNGRIVELATPDVLDTAFTIGSVSGHDNRYPSVAAMGGEPAGTGTYLVTWAAYPQNAGAEDIDYIAGQKVSGDGVLIGGTFSLSAPPNNQYCPKTAANENARSFFTTYGTDYQYYPDPPSYFIHGRYLRNYAAAISGEHWLGVGISLYGPCTSVVGGGERDFMAVMSYRAQNASFNQIWATVIRTYPIYLPIVRR